MTVLIRKMDGGPQQISGYEVIDVESGQQIHGIAKASIEITGNRPVISLTAIGDVEVEGKADIFRETDERMALLIPALLPFLRGVKDSSVWVQFNKKQKD